MYRILALDGGGMRGLITVTLLCRLVEAVPGCLRNVDLITGSSTGGILAIALANGSRPEELMSLYTSASPGYFPTVDGFADGGIFAYHPGAAALTWVQAGRVPAGESVALEETALLSLGTGTARHYLAGERHDWSIARWFPSMLRLLRDGNVGLVDYQCRLLLGDRYHRLSPRLQHAIPSDAWVQCELLQQIGRSVDIRPTVKWLRANWARGEGEGE